MTNKGRVRVKAALLSVALSMIGGNVSAAAGAGALDRFPDPDWPVAPTAAAAGTTDEKLAAYQSWLDERAGTSWASVIIKDGYLVYSGRGPRSHVRQKNDCGSLLKPLQATVLGAALLQGKLKSIDENAFDYWKDPFLTPYANDRAITFRQFAQYHDRWNQPQPPGTLDYNNSSATAAGYCIAGLFEDIHGPKPSQGIAPIARREVMEKIHADWDLWHWTEDFPPASWQDGPRLVLDSSVYELAKLGYLWLRKGRWKDTRIFSEEFYRDAVTDWSPDMGDGRFSNYGYWWFINTDRAHLPAVPADAFYAYGWGEPKRATLLLVIPSVDVVAILSMERLSDDKKWDVIQNARGKTNDGPRPWSQQVMRLVGAGNAGHAAPALLPKPQHFAEAEGRLVLSRDLTIVVPQAASSRVREIAGVLRDELASRYEISSRVEGSDAPPPSGSVSLRLSPAPDGKNANPESYSLEIGDRVEISAPDTRGLLWGVQSLLQGIAAPSRESPTVVRGTISDEPAWGWRAVMLDPVRSFLDLDFIRRTIRVMSAYKLNILHLHLIDDHAWRFETKAFPLCNRPGEPFYTQAELKDLVAFAQRYGVEIIPEFDFPGHAHAAVTAYPELDCEGKPRAMDEAIFCAGKPFTWEFMDKVIAEAAAIFPSRYIHLGADEPFAVKRWSTCPNCQARMRAKGVATTPALYHTFVADLDDLVKRHGRTLIVWNDALTPNVAPLPPKDIIIDAWTNDRDVKALAEAGYTLVNSSNRPLYLSSYGQRQGFPLSAVWQWTPRRFGLRAGNAGDADLKATPLPPGANVLGGQACAWATEQGLMERRLYPRLLAVAEALWSGEARGDYAEFMRRLGAGQMTQLHRIGVPDDDVVPSEKIFTEADSGTSAESRPGTFTIGDGVLRVAAGSSSEGWVTKRKYRDFVLTFERRADQNSGTTGFFIRCASATPAAAAPGFPVLSTPPPGMKIVAQDVRELRGWNQFELTARGQVVSLTVNGYLAWSVTDPAPQAGFIALKGDANGFEVRNAAVRSLDR